MSAAKRKICEEETESEKKKAARMDDRLGDLPEALKLHILACLDTKQAVQTSVLSKTWVSLWTRIPILEFNYVPPDQKIRVVDDKFVNWVLCRRDHLTKLDRLKLNCATMFINTDTVKSVIDYAFSHGVRQLEVSVNCISEIYAWPVSPSDSLTSLKLETWSDPIRVLFLGPRSISFKNLTVLYLTYAVITDVEPFSGFPVLERLTLFSCVFLTKGDENKTLRVHALRLSDLTIAHFRNMKYCELRTPRLRFLDYGGSEFPKHEGLNDLETLIIDTERFYTQIIRNKLPEKRLFDGMLSLFSTLHNLKSLTFLSGTALLLLLFPFEFMRLGLPFRELKDLHVDLLMEDRYCPLMFHRGFFEFLKAYMLHNYPDAKFTIASPESKSCKCVGYCRTQRCLWQQAFRAFKTF